MNGDVLTDLNFNSFFQKHVDDKRIFSISAAKRTAMIDYGVLEYDNENRLNAFIEKPTHNYSVSMGVYAANIEILAHIPDHKAFGFDDLMLNLLELDKHVSVIPFDGYWLDIGRPEDYEKACNKLSETNE